jgi:hypothetical protein
MSISDATKDAIEDSLRSFFASAVFGPPLTASPLLWRKSQRILQFFALTVGEFRVEIRTYW